MYCRNCGVSNPTDSERCKKCGQPRNTMPAASNPAQPQTQVAYPYNNAFQAPHGQVPVTATAFASPPSVRFGQVPTTPEPAIAPPPPMQYRPTGAMASKSAGLANLFEILLPGSGFLYAGDAGGGVAIFISTLVFVLINFLLAGIFHGLAFIFMLVVLLVWFVVRLVVVNHVVNKRNAQGVIVKSSAIAGFLEVFCPGMGCFYARKVGAGFALLSSTIVAVIGAGFITYALAVQAYQNFNNSAAGVIYNLCAKNPGCNKAGLAGPDFTSFYICLIIVSVILVIWLIVRIVMAVNMVEKQKKSHYLWGTVYK